MGKSLKTTCNQNLNLWLVAAFILMIMYEAWWVRYFRSERRLSDFYSSFLEIPLAGATLPVAAFFILGIYGKVICMLIATIILGIGPIGIHIQHKKGCCKNNFITVKHSISIVYGLSFL